MSSWYQKCMPRIKDVKDELPLLLEDLKKMNGIKSLHVWGSYAKNVKNPNFRVRDIDVIVKTAFYSGDLLSVNNDIIKEINTENYLASMGYDPETVYFSKEFVKLSANYVDCWAISSDRKLLHWGVINDSKKDFDEIKQRAENYANQTTKINRNKLNKSSESNRKNWHDIYCDYMNSYFEDSPIGWYQTEKINVKEILAETIKII